MKSAFPLLHNYTQTLLGSHLASSQSCFRFAKTPVVAQLSLRLQQRTFNAAYFHNDFMAKQILV